MKDKELRKAIRNGLKYNLEKLLRSGTFKVYDNGKNTVIYKEDKLIELSENGDVYFSLNNKNKPNK